MYDCLKCIIPILVIVCCSCFFVSFIIYDTKYSENYGGNGCSILKTGIIKKYSSINICKNNEHNVIVEIDGINKCALNYECYDNSDTSHAIYDTIDVYYCGDWGCFEPEISERLLLFGLKIFELGFIIMIICGIILIVHCFSI